MAEWLKAHAWKACLGESLTWVRIPPAPPAILTSLLWLRGALLNPRKAAAMTFIKKAMKRHSRTKAITTDGLRSYKAAMTEIGAAEKQEVGRWANNRCENSHQPFRRRERAMLRFRQMKSLQKFASVHASLHNHFNSERHLVDRQTFKLRRSAAWAEWQNLAA